MELHRHPLPEAITSIADLRLFMEHHVFAVWDFMLLLKSLQQHLAPSGVPWVPPRHPEIAGLVNSLVAEEECDVLPDSLGGPLHLCHFAIYRRAMLEIGADTAVIDAVLELASHGDFASALHHPDIPAPAAHFLRTNQALIASGEVHVLAAAFAYGRELLVPNLFRGLLDRLIVLELPCPTLRWYLERHIASGRRQPWAVGGNDGAHPGRKRPCRAPDRADRSQAGARRSGCVLGCDCAPASPAPSG